VLSLEPDLVVVYSGNNEFLEPRSYLRGADLPAVLRGLASLRWLRRALLPLTRPEAVLAADRRENASFEVWAKLRQQALVLRSDPAQLARVRDHYADSIRRMVEEARAAGVPIVLVTVPVNLRDWQPNVSAGEPGAAAGKAWRAKLAAGRRALAAGDLRDGVRALREAADLAPLHAHTRFWLAGALEAEGRYEEALRAYRAAADLDMNPFRAPSSFNQILREVAERAPDALLADAEAAFLTASAPRAPGFDLFLDYVHPTKTGNLLVARSVFDAALDGGVFGTAGPRPPFSAPIGDGYDATSDPRVQRALFTLFAMMHQHEVLVAKAREYAAHEEPEWRFARNWLGVFEPLLELERRRLAGEVVPEMEAARVTKRLEAFYARQYPRALAHD
jgi:hypothetical protein